MEYLSKADGDGHDDKRLKLAHQWNGVQLDSSAKSTPLSIQQVPFDIFMSKLKNLTPELFDKIMSIRMAEDFAEASKANAAAAAAVASQPPANWAPPRPKPFLPQKRSLDGKRRSLEDALDDSTAQVVHQPVLFDAFNGTRLQGYGYALLGQVKEYVLNKDTGFTPSTPSKLTCIRRVAIVAASEIEVLDHWTDETRLHMLPASNHFDLIFRNQGIPAGDQLAPEHVYFDTKDLPSEAASHFFVFSIYLELTRTRDSVGVKRLKTFTIGLFRSNCSACNKFFCQVNDGCERNSSARAQELALSLLDDAFGVKHSKENDSIQEPPTNPWGPPNDPLYEVFQWKRQDDSVLRLQKKNQHLGQQVYAQVIAHLHQQFLMNPNIDFPTYEAFSEQA